MNENSNENSNENITLSIVRGIKSPIRLFLSDVTWTSIALRNIQRLNLKLLTPLFKGSDVPTKVCLFAWCLTHIGYIVPQE